MKLRPLKFLTLLLNWIKRRKSTQILPQSFGYSEKIIRSVYSPININKNKGTLNSNTFRTPPNKDEVSVNRLDYTNANFCKNISKANQSVGQRDYFGFAVISKFQIELSNCGIVYTPILKPKEKINIFHSDIKIGYIPERGKELPSEVSKKINDLTKLARFYIDPNPNSNYWEGNDLT